MIAAIWLRPLLQRPLRALATVLGVATGVASVLATALASSAAVASMTADVESLTGVARLEVTRPGGVPLAELERLRPLCSEVELVPVVEGTALATRSGELVRVLGIDFLGASTLAGLGLEGTTTLAEASAKLLRGEGVALSQAGARRLGVAAGERLELVLEARPVELEVALVFEPEVLASAHERTLFLDVARAQELLGRTTLLDRLELVPRPGVATDGLAARAEALVAPGTRVADASARRAEGERFVRSLRFNLTALAGVSVLVAIVLVATTLATSVVERRGTIAILRALGASSRQLAAAVLLEAAAIGLLGGLLGVALGRLGAGLIVGDVHASFASLAEDISAGAVTLDPAWIGWGLLIGIGSALVAAWLPLGEARRTPPVQNLRASSDAERPVRALRALGLTALLAAAALAAARVPPWNERPLGALVSALLLLATLLVLSGPLVALLTRLPAGALGARLAPAIALAQSALAAARGRAAWAAGAVGVAVALAVAMGTMVGSFRTSVIGWTDETLRADLSIRPLASPSGANAGKLPAELSARVAELVGAENLDPYHECAATLDGVGLRLGAGALAVLAREGGVPFLDGRDSREVFAEALARGGALVNEPAARRFGLARGSKVRVTTAGGTLEREVIGVYRDYSGHLGRVILDNADYFTIAPAEGPDSLSIHLPAESDVGAVRATLERELGREFALEVRDNAEVKAEVLRVFERTFGVTVGLQALASLVAALAVVLVLSALVRERERDLAIVRVLGGSRRQISALVSTQALLLGFAGAAGGLVVGLVVGYLLVTVVNVQSFGWSLDFAPPAAVVWTAAAVLPACLAAGLVPAWLSQRLEPQEVLREAD